MWRWLTLTVAVTLGAGTAAAETIRVDPDPCAASANLDPPADAALAPGRDVGGRPVAPADNTQFAAAAAPPFLDILVETRPIHRNGWRWRVPQLAPLHLDMTTGELTVRGRPLYDAGSMTPEACAGDGRTP